MWDVRASAVGGCMAAQRWPEARQGSDSRFWLHLEGTAAQLPAEGLKGRLGSQGAAHPKPGLNAEACFNDLASQFLCGHVPGPGHPRLSHKQS